MSDEAGENGDSLEVGDRTELKFSKIWSKLIDIHCILCQALSPKDKAKALREEVHSFFLLWCDLFLTAHIYNILNFLPKKKKKTSLKSG